MDANISLKDIKGLIRRRYKVSIAIFCVTILISSIIAFVLPSIYSSTAMILIEEQQIPKDYVKSTITSYAEERLDMITRQIMKYSQLSSIIQQFDLYPDLVDSGNIGQAVREMKEDISIKPISVKEGRKSATVAFTLTHEGPDPVVVQKVTNALSQLYLKEELKVREKQVSVTTDFLKKELENLKEQLKIHEERISQFKSRHIGELPENAAFNMQNISRMEVQNEGINSRIRSLEDRKIYLKGQLANIDPLSPVTTEQGKLAMNPKERLKVLHLDLIRMQARLSNKHPDIRKIKSEIAKLEDQVGHSDESVEKIKMLSERKAKLAELKSRLSHKHPDITRLQKEIKILSKQVDKLVTEKSIVEISEEKPDNPAYINLLTQVVAAETEIKSLQQQQATIKENLEEFRKKVSSAPIVEKEYNELTLDFNNAKLKYNEILNKLMTAQVAQQMEEQQMGEKFIILESAYLPSTPTKPNRIAIILLGFVIGSGLALGTAAIHEKLDRSIKDEDELVRLTGIPVLTTFSVIRKKNHRQDHGMGDKALKMIFNFLKR